MTGAESQVTVYQPVQISALVQASILGENQQITKWGGNIVKLSKTHLPEEYSTTKDGCSCVLPETCLWDDIVGIRFLADGRFLPHMSNPVSLFPVGGTARHTKLTVDFDQTHTWDDQEAEHTAEGLLSLIPTLPHPRSTWLPEFRFISDEYDQIPWDAILNQVRALAVNVFLRSLT
jgi:hypothetical protein